MVTTARLKDQVFNLIATRKSVSFAELERIPGFKGDQMYGVLESNIYMWFAMSQPAVDAVEELLADDLIRLDMGNLLSYIADGAVPRYPLVEKLRRYSEPHWFPIVLNPTREGILVHKQACMRAKALRN